MGRPPAMGGPRRWTGSGGRLVERRQSGAWVALEHPSGRQALVSRWRSTWSTCEQSAAQIADERSGGGRAPAVSGLQR
ncbi:hypothetical protein GCM10009741_13940 [Kribbella lupini]|uniref:Uncharacterized protein n=1 Tax=Kribbella lupini TaxID=291602 RepID=A0ABN2ACE4_9ACTN